MMKRQCPNVCNFLQPAHDGVWIVHDLVCISLMNGCDAGVQFPQTFCTEILQFEVARIPADEVEVMAVHQVFGKNPFCKNQYLVPVIAGDHGIEVDFKPFSKAHLQFPEDAGSQNGFIEVPWNSAHRVMGVLKPIQGDVDIQLQPGIGFQTPLRYLDNPSRLQAICWKVDVAHSVVFHEERNNVFQIRAQCRLAAAEPQIGDLWGVLGELDDFLPVQITGLI